MRLSRRLALLLGVGVAGVVLTVVALRTFWSEAPTGRHGIAETPNSLRLFAGSDAGKGGYHVSAWRAIDVRSYGVPASAISVTLGVATAVDKGEVAGAASVFLIVRSLGGPKRRVARASIHRAQDITRDITSVVVRPRDGRFDLAWGYRKVAGDAVSITVYLNEYAT